MGYTVFAKKTKYLCSHIEDLITLKSLDTQTPTLVGAWITEDPLQAMSSF